MHCAYEEGKKYWIWMSHVPRSESALSVWNGAHKRIILLRHNKKHVIIDNIVFDYSLQPIHSPSASLPHIIIDTMRIDEKQTLTMLCQVFMHLWVGSSSSIYFYNSKPQLLSSSHTLVAIVSDVAIAFTQYMELVSNITHSFVCTRLVYSFILSHLVSIGRLFTRNIII